VHAIFTFKGCKPRRSTTILRQSSDDEFIDFEHDASSISPRKSNRFVMPGFFRVDSNSDSDESVCDSFGEDELLEVSHKIDHIFMSRKSSRGVEYLVTFQDSPSPFSQWVAVDILSDSPNFVRQFQKFKSTQMNLSFYETTNHTFEISHKSPLRILSHRLMERDRPCEFLYQLSLETGTTFFWEDQGCDSPQNLVDHYLHHRKCVLNTHPPYPSSLQIPHSLADSFRSADGHIPRDYQIEGVNWILEAFTAGHGCILADEMGLGKTIQALVCLMHLDRVTDWHGPHLIAVRPNTFVQWCSEIERWTDFAYIAYTGQPEARQSSQTIRSRTSTRREPNRCQQSRLTLCSSRTIFS
jgi:hypothetical protein